MRLTLVTPPDTTPVDLVAAKAQCRVDHDDEDVFIQSLIDAATQYLDGPHGILGRAVMPQVWLLELTGWASGVTLPVEPVRSVVVTYTDAGGDEQTLDAANYSLTAWPSMATELRLDEDLVRPALDRVDYPVRVSISAGYADVDAVPAPLKTAILMIVAHWYKNREAVSETAMAEIPLAADTLIAPHRRLL